METMRRTVLWSLTFTGALALAAGVMAGDPEPTPTPTPTPAPERTATAPTPTPAAGSLAAVAGKIKLKGDRSRGGEIVITNDNIGGYAARGKLIIAKGSAPAEPGEKASDGGPSGTGTDEKPGAAKKKDAEQKREYWRNRYRQQLQKVKTMRKRIEELDREIPGLWTQFYSWDDPAYRDGVIKPKLDRALAERDELAKKLPAEEAKLDQIRDEARRDGALPGWFRGLDSGD